jgi:addiction module HigA family antidote
MITLKGIDPNMIANNIEPLEPTHPGSIIKEEIESRGITQKEFAAQTGLSRSVLNDILNEKRSVNIEYALLFEAALGIDADFWISMQNRYDIIKVKRNKSFSQRLEKIRKYAAML